MRAEILFNAKTTLGEAPAWDSKNQTLYWVDILKKRIYAGTEIIAQLDEYVGCLAPCKNGHLILALSAVEAPTIEARSCFKDFDPSSKKSTSISSLDSESSTNRFNDGKCDPAGRFIAGTMDMNEKNASGSLYSFDGKKVTRLLANIRISNGLTWSPDYKTFYTIDTPSRAVKAFDYDLSSGQIANPRVAVSVPESLGWPDGMTSDIEGNLWIAIWGGAQVTKWNPNTSKLLEQIPIPALQTSSCIFGGNEMNELYVTSARVGMSATDLNKYPLSGGLFKISTKVQGIPTFEFRG